MKNLAFDRWLICLFGFFVALLFSTGTWAGQKTNCPKGSDAPYCDKAQPTSNGLNRSLEVPPVLSGDLSNKGSEPMTQTEYEASMSSANLISAIPGTPTWGALAKDPWLSGAVGVGVANNRLTQEEAMLDALTVCVRNGGKDCYIEELYSNRCIGLSLNEQGQLFWSVGRNTDESSFKVLALCSEKSQASCKLIYNSCSYAVQK